MILTLSRAKGSHSSFVMPFSVIVRSLPAFEFLDQERLDLAFLEHAQLPPTERGVNVDSEREFIGLAGPRLHGCADLVQPALAEDPEDDVGGMRLELLTCGFFQPRGNRPDQVAQDRRPEENRRVPSQRTSELA
jgi:hypothetical protein